MVQYFLNCSAIWFLSLLFFDVFLSRETYHQYNRIYLLFTFAAGILLPLWTWHSNSIIYHSVYTPPITSVQSVRETVVSTISSTPTEQQISIQSVLQYVYFTGVIIAICILLLDVVKVIRLYHSGKRYRTEKNVVVETGKEHSPFSLLHIVFIKSSIQYTKTELQIIFDHENSHNRLLHLADIMMMQAARIVLWFHPFVYMYHSRLLMVHEYQADALYIRHPKEYGSFLISQSLLSGAPTITHSFNRSPIKKRIVMLTSRSTKKSFIKLFIIFPLIAVCLLCFTQTGYSFKKGSKKTIVFKGNEFEFGWGGSAKNDSLATVQEGLPAQILKLMATDKTLDAADTQLVYMMTPPTKMNGKKIYDIDEVTSAPVFMGEQGDMGTYLCNGILNEASALNDGTYSIMVSYLVIDQKGKLVYYKNNGIGAEKRTNNNEHLEDKIKKRIDNLLDNAPGFTPANLNNQPVICKTVFMYSSIRQGVSHLVVKNHQAKILKMPMQLLRNTNNIQIINK